MVGEFDSYIESFSKTLEYDKEVLLLEISNNIVECMEKRNIKNTELADLLGTSRGHITHILRGDVNFTLKKLIQIARALDCKLECPQFVPSNTPASVRRIYDYANKVCWESITKYLVEESVYYSVSEPSRDAMLDTYAEAS